MSSMRLKLIKTYTTSNPETFQSYIDDHHHGLFGECLKNGVALAVANGFPSQNDEEKLPLLGSWTAFDRSISKRVKQRYYLLSSCPS